MDTKKITTEYRLSQWAKIVQERSNSGLSIKVFCENAGMRETTYYYWLKKLREKACETLPAIQENPQQPKLESSVFAEVKLPESPALSSNETHYQNQICIEAAGVRLTAGDGYPIEKLAGLLREVMRPC